MVGENEGRLRSLVEANRMVAGEIELPTVLRTIVQAAVELVGARYGAMGIIAADGTLEQFIHVGMPVEIVAGIGHLPEGHGLLGALIAVQEPIRLAELGDDPRSGGFPVSHPPMRSFLGVPVRVRNEVFGNLYLSDENAGMFSAEDQELLLALAASAGAAIDHARLFEEAQRRHGWAAASAEVTSLLLSGDGEDALSLIAGRALELTDADLAYISLPVRSGRMLVAEASGLFATDLAQEEFDSTDTIAGRAFESGQPVLMDAESKSSAHPNLSVGPTISVPLAVSEGRAGVLTVSRRAGRSSFRLADVDMVADFAEHVDIAIRLAAGRSDRQRLALLEDRSRIARDLHDHVIQRLFGAGLALQGLAGTIKDPLQRERITEQVAALDAAISDIRTAIFTISWSATHKHPSLRHLIVDLLSENQGMLADTPRLTFSGPVDVAVPAELAEDVIAVVREGLANVAKHARAAQTAVSVVVAEGSIVVQVEDDGVGIHPDTAGAASGTENLAHRAELRGGSFDLLPRTPSGTVLSWSVPLGRERENDQSLPG
jgi:signal transduction histidine kinase